jgi:phenylalanyl-tRNA synthetase alpha chain
MKAELESLRTEALADLRAAGDAKALEAWRIQYLSRQGRLPAVLEGMKGVSKEDRPVIGKLANEIKQELTGAFDALKNGLDVPAAAQVEDPTLPGLPLPVATRHVVRQTLDRIIRIFNRMGYALADGPEVEYEFFNFDALNTPPDHPARNEQDTFYLKAGSTPWGRPLLRTQTSPVQIRVMQQQKPPIQIIAPGRCYRRDEIDATHGVFFHQVEGLYVAERLSVADLKGTLEYFFRELMGPATQVRFRPHFFPFTEPSFEVDMSNPGEKVRGKEWLEICGCGMVDPAVLETVGIDPDRYQGFAFGMGVERIAMLRHKVPDLRYFYENDIRFLSQFGG